MSNKFINIIARNNDQNTYFNIHNGISCFSKNNDNILLWSHYADNHKGYCLEFNIDREKDIFDFLQPDTNLIGKYIDVKYVESDKRPNLKFVVNNTYENMEKLLSSKYKEWQYENELRIFVQNSGKNNFPRPIKYRKEKLTNIILGNRFTFRNFDKMYSKGVFKDLDVSVVCLDENTYNFKIVKINNVDSVYDFIYAFVNNDDNWIYDCNEIKRLKKERGAKLSRNKMNKLWKKVAEESVLSNLYSLDFIDNIDDVMELLKTKSGNNIELNYKISTLLDNIFRKLKCISLLL